IAIAPPVSPPKPGGVQVLYATLQGTGGAPDPVGVFLSTDQGATWTRRTATGMPTGTQGGYSFHMAVDPGSPGDGACYIIYLGAVVHARSTDSVNSFTGLAGLHADNHSWAFFPQPSRLPRSCSAATTAASIDPPMRAPTGHRSVAAACKRDCSTTSTSAPTQLERTASGRFRTTGPRRELGRSAKVG